MSCSNCFNGCTEITSDQCVRYTGNNIPALGIENGDTLATVELQIITYITNLATGAGIVPVINPADLCPLVSGFLPGSGTITLNNVISALIKSVCSLKTSVDAINSTLTILNADYTIGCLTGVTASSDTHAILQAAITKLCATDTALTAFINNVTTNYVTIASLDDRIQEYLDEIAPTNLQKNKMVPYVAYEYYGPITGFDMTGEGSGEWDRVFLCNGNNGTPDKRGRVAVGVTTGMGGGAMNPNVNPGGGNPNYTIASITGTNTVTLTGQQIPLHTHTATATVTDPGHNHQPANGGDFAIWLNNQANAGSGSTGFEVSPNNHPASTNTKTTGISVSVSNSQFGGGLGHANIQPSIGAYYIMYRP
jgi:microcystin-dependent protein